MRTFSRPMEDAGAGHQSRLFHLLRRCQTQFTAVKEVFQLDLVHLQVTPYCDEDHLSVAGIEDGLEGLALRYSQEGRQVFNGLDSRSGDFFQGKGIFRLLWRLDHLGFLGVGRVAAAGAYKHHVFPALRRQQELVGVFSADGAAVGFRLDRGQVEASVDVLVGLHHRLIAAVETLLVRIEAVGVLHIEFTQPL